MEGLSSATSLGTTYERQKAKPQHYFLIVQVQVENVSRTPNCTRATVALMTDRGYQLDSDTVPARRQPYYDDLPPQERAEGAYVFTLQDGFREASLIFTRDPVREEFCETVNNRPSDTSGPSELHLSLQGAPSSR